jgi:hypothetical protein
MFGRTLETACNPHQPSTKEKGQITTDGEQIDTMVITDHLYLHGSGGALFDIRVGKDASGKDVVTATPAGG